MDQDSFMGNVGRGFASGIGTIIAYGLAFVLLSLVVKDEDKPKESARPVVDVTPQAAALPPPAYGGVDYLDVYNAQGCRI